MTETEMPYDRVRLCMTECRAEDHEAKIAALEQRIIALETALARVADTQSDIRRRLANDERHQQHFEETVRVSGTLGGIRP